MKTVIIHVEDSKYGFLINLLKKFNFISFDTQDEAELFTEKQKKLLDKRLDELLDAKTDSLDWENVQQILK